MLDRDRRNGLESDGFAPIPGVTVIGLGHKARHGKDTAAEAILRAYPIQAKRFGFADDLYAIARVRHGMTVKDAPLLQQIGVSYRDNFGANVWVRAVYAKMLDARPRLVVIPDVRFPNELEFVKALGGTTVKVTRRNPDGSLFIDPSRPADHISETALDDAIWDMELINCGVLSLRADAIGVADAVLLEAGRCTST